MHTYDDSEKGVVRALEHLGYDEVHISLCGEWCSLDEIGPIGTTDEIDIAIGKPGQTYARLRDAETGLLLGRARQRKKPEDEEEGESASNAPELSDCLPWAG